MLPDYHPILLTLNGEEKHALLILAFRRGMPVDELITEMIVRTLQEYGMLAWIPDPNEPIDEAIIHEAELLSQR